jgi:hypothetical protein
VWKQTIVEKVIDGPLRGLDYRLERVGMRNRFERFFRYLKMSARDHILGILNLKLFLNLIL